MLLTATLTCLHPCLIAQSRLDSIFAPVRVGTPPSDAYIGLSMLEDGEVRHYNYGEQADAGTFYWSSTDKGLSWTKVPYAREMLFADRQSPVSKEYIRLVNMGRQGVYCIRTIDGPNGGRTLTKVTDIPSIMLKPPVFIRDGKRIVVGGHNGVSPKGCYTFVSDDDGRTWTRSNTVTVPDHVAGGLHKGVRWNHGAVEPTVIELMDGRLWMLMRTAQDRHYQAFSDDGGLTWGEAGPSPFYGTITMPTIGRLKDGRILFLWCNTTPLPEVSGTHGRAEDVFTNRNVTHAAISADDGRTWIGFRELYIDPARNASDYGIRGGGGRDRSVHQAQFVEVAPGKILAAIGQHPLHRAMLLFDVNWLYEQGRHDDFSDGLQHWSTFNYIKGIVGHCAYNRIQGCSLEPHPDQNGKQVLHLRHQPDTSLVSDIRGAVWNFPALRTGSFSTRLSIPRENGRSTLLLNDRWLNPTDTTARHACMYELSINRKELGIRDDGWHEVTLSWNLGSDPPFAQVWVDGKKTNKTIPLRNPSRMGIHYAHFIASPSTEHGGIRIASVRSGPNRQP